MFKVLLGAIALFALQVVFFEQSAKVLIFAHNMFSDIKVVYHASKSVIAEKDHIEKFNDLMGDLTNKSKRDSTKSN